MDCGLTGRAALVTGSSQGIGRATARQFAREGVRVGITWRRESHKAETTAKEIRSDGGDAIALHLDLASFESIDAAIEAIMTRWRRIDILVNNAIQWAPTRISQSPDFETYPVQEWQPQLRVNMEGVYFLIQSVLPCMRERQWGRIVNVSSVVAEDGLRGAGWYAMVKGSLHGLTRTLSKELGPAGILVNCVMPGLTGTDRIESVSPAVRQRVEESSPLRRVLTPDEVGSAIVFLCSTVNSAITGEIIRLGGRF